MLPDEELHRKVEGVEDVCEGGHQGLLHLDATHLHHGDLHVAYAHDGLLVHAAYGEVSGERLGLLWPLAAPLSLLRRVV